MTTTTLAQPIGAEDLRPGMRIEYFPGSTARVLSAPVRHSFRLWLLVQEPGQDPRIAVYFPDSMVNALIPLEASDG